MANYYELSDLQKILNTCVEQYELEFGKADKTFDSFFNLNGYYSVINQCRIYQKAKRFIIITRYKRYIIPFNKIIGYEVVDLKNNRKPLFNATTETTKTDTGDIVKRAIIGGAIAGDVGAIIGGATAKRTKSQSRAEQDAAIMGAYIDSLPSLELVIKFDDVLNPTITIPFDSFKQNIEEFAESLNVVVRRNAENYEVEESEVIKEGSGLWDAAKTLGIEWRDDNGLTQSERQVEKIEREDREERQNLYNTISIVFFIASMIFIFWVSCS